MGQLLTVNEVSERVRVIPLTVRRWIKSGELKAFKPGGDRAGWRIDEDDLAAFVEQRTSGQEMGKAAA